MSIKRWVTRRWYGKPGALGLLLPLEWLYTACAKRRRQRYAQQPERRYRAGVPVIVVGNISVGGTGKSPTVAWLVAHLRERGWQPGIASRGYGGHADQYPLLVEPTTPPQQAGDEPVMLRLSTGVPVAVAPARADAVKLLEAQGCNIIVTDDGLQHYALERDIELVVIDGERGLGNGHCLPVGPLREPPARLADANAVLINGTPRVELPVDGWAGTLSPLHLRRLSDSVRQPLSPLPFSGKVHAVAGIGHPERFFATLDALGIEVIRHPFGDHHQFTQQDISFGDQLPIVMTAKDAVKCQPLLSDTMRASSWALEVALTPETGFSDWLDSQLEPWSHVRREDVARRC
ncbi:Tetraacyldisaccharide 4'-kinase [Carnimonas sp. R-84981]|uniref:tetraacyldisaccharide 4'-kinase n=1 Tax=Carnimonas bestiolae TaxID=3402172 RepID=UPI003EDCA210